jgi:hypothetical protein
MFRAPVALMPVKNAYLRLGRMRSGGVSDQAARRLWHGRDRHHVPDRQHLGAPAIAPHWSNFGVIFGMVGLVALLGLKAPPSTDDAAQGGVFTPTAMTLKTPIFWLMFVMMNLMSTSGQMVTSQMATFGADFGVT